MTPDVDSLTSRSDIAVRPADPAIDAIDDVLPGLVVEPRTADGVAATLAWASANRLSVVIRGAGTKTPWGRRPAPVDVVLSMRALAGIRSHRAGDLTVSVDAGLTLGELNQVLAEHRQWLPLDPPFGATATIGGLLSTNDSGPRRHRFGTPRDQVIGIQIATADGKLAKAGGQVVKNVAGYDLSKLLSGSFGSLAAIVGATFKLAPLPEASGTLVIDDLDPAALSTIAGEIGSTQLEPTAFELSASRVAESGGWRLWCLLRFETTAGALEEQLEGARAIVDPFVGSVHLVRGEEEARLWEQHASRPWSGVGAIVSASWMPADLEKALTTIGRTAGVVDIVGRIGVGAGAIRIEGNTAQQAGAIDELRRATIVGNVVVRRGSPALKHLLDVWPPTLNTRLIQSVKRALDPHGILGAGRGVG